MQISLAILAMQRTCHNTSDSQRRLDLFAPFPERHCRYVGHLTYLHLPEKLVAVLRCKVNDCASKRSRVLAKRDSVLLNKSIDSECLPFGPFAQIKPVCDKRDIVRAMEHRHLQREFSQDKLVVRHHVLACEVADGGDISHGLWGCSLSACRIKRRPYQTKR